MKVFQIGFNRCGTTSLYHFFKQNNHRSVHWNDFKWDKYFKNNQSKNKLLCDGVDDIIFWSDIEFVQRQFQVFAEQYPNSKFIYNTRNIDNWIESRKKHYTDKTNFFKDIYNQKLKLNKFNLTLENYWKSEWIYHKQVIDEYFVGDKKKRLLIFDIEKDSSDKIINFLPELNFIDTKFPHRNKSKKPKTEII